MKDNNYKLWYSEIENISYRVIKYLSSLKLPVNPVVVFDIDDTLILSNGIPIKPIIKVYNFVKSLGIIPIIITNRLGVLDSIEFTKTQLKNNGINEYKSLYFRPPGRENNPYRYKEKSRENIYQRGMNVIMSIGDQYWDIGKYGGVGVILPILYI